MTVAALRAVMPSDASSREDLTDGRDRLTLLHSAQDLPQLLLDFAADDAGDALDADPVVGDLLLREVRPADQHRHVHRPADGGHALAQRLVHKVGRDEHDLRDIATQLPRELDRHALRLARQRRPVTGRELGADALHERAGGQRAPIAQTLVDQAPRLRPRLTCDAGHAAHQRGEDAYARVRLAQDCGEIPHADGWISGEVVQVDQEDVCLRRDNSISGDHSYPFW